MSNGSLVKTTQFKLNKARFVGDPINSLRIFNELEVDELFLLDVSASKMGREPDFGLLKEIASECFMPVAYGGGVHSINSAERVIGCGVEKVVVNSAVLDDPTLVDMLSRSLGSQAVVVAVDFWTSRQQLRVFDHRQSRAKTRTSRQLLAWAAEVESRGCGELLITSTEREGTWSGADELAIREVMSDRKVPVIYQGGVASLTDAHMLAERHGLSGIAVGSLTVFSRENGGVLVHLPET